MENAKKILKDKLESPKWPQYAHLRDHVIPMTLYSQQKPQLTKDAVAKGRPDKRRVVFSTNVAETSLTIDGVTVVVDAGFTKESLYDHQKRMKILQVYPASSSRVPPLAGSIACYYDTLTVHSCPLEPRHQRLQFSHSDIAASCQTSLCWSFLTHTGC